MTLAKDAVPTIFPSTTDPAPDMYLSVSFHSNDIAHDQQPYDDGLFFRTSFPVHNSVAAEIVKVKLEGDDDVLVK